MLVVADGMWGILRVYPFTTSAAPTGSGVAVNLARLGVPVDGPHLSPHVDGAPIAATAETPGAGRHPPHPARPTHDAPPTHTHPAPW